MEPDEYACTTADVWMHPPKNFNIERRYIQRRAGLLPYLYNATWNLYMNGIHIMRPMYYDYTEDDAAYENQQQYMYGDMMIIAPITKFSGSDYGFNLTQQKIWIPNGDSWYEENSGYYYTNTMNSRMFDLSEVPVYIKVRKCPIIQKRVFSNRI